MQFVTYPNTHNIYKLLHVSAPMFHLQGVITTKVVWPTNVQSQAGWLVHPCRNKSLRMARRCRNMLEFMYVTCILSRIAYFGYYTDYKHRQGFFSPMPPHVLCGLRGPPSWARQECNRLLRLGRPWGAVTLSRWCVSGDRGCSARRVLKPKFC